MSSSLLIYWVAHPDSVKLERCKTGAKCAQGAQDRHLLVELGDGLLELVGGLDLVHHLQHGVVHAPDVSNQHTVFTHCGLSDTQHRLDVCVQHIVCGVRHTGYT